MRVTKRLDLGLLEKQLAAAGVAHQGLGTSGEAPNDPGAQELFTYDPDGVPIELPAAAVPVVNAHVAPPVAYEYAGSQQITGVLHTTNDTPTSIWRFTPEPDRLYRVMAGFMATNPGLAGTFFRDEIYAFKKIGNNPPVIVGSAPIFDVPETQSADWDTGIAVAGVEVVIQVIGERTGPVDWLFAGTLVTYAPGGLA